MTYFMRLRAAYYMARGYRHLHLADFPRAVVYLEKSTRIDPEEASVWLWLGHAYLGIEKVSEATNSYLRYYHIQKAKPASQWSPLEASDFDEGMRKLADCLVWQGRKTELSQITAELHDMRRED